MKRKVKRRGLALRNFIFLHYNRCCLSIVRINRSELFLIDEGRVHVSSMKILSTLLKPVWNCTKNTCCYGISKTGHFFKQRLKLLDFPAKQSNMRFNVLHKSCSVLPKLLEYQIAFEE